MKKLSLTLVAFFALSVALTSLAWAEVTLSYSNFFPPTHIHSKLAEQWCKEVEKRTDGKVKINYYPGSTLTKAKQNYDGVVEGISDIGMSCLAYSRGRFPTMAAVDLPMGYASGVQATQVANAVYKKFDPKELSDVQPMYFHAHGPGLLFTTEKPVAVMEDLAGLKIRATGNSAKLIKALGGTPVAKSMSENYQLLQKGVVDGSIHPVESNKGWKLAEVVKFGTESFSVGYTTTFFVVMNKDKWDALDAETQKIISEINDEWALKHGQAWDEADAEGKAYFLEKGGKFIPLSAEESARWAKAAQPVMREYEKNVAEKGIDGKAVVEFIEAEMAK
ncbi:C4-dicarboxylate ABC transporter substrate-binding protein [Pseudodesulfovibrio cashew]|uniref:C4-dicarboxylate ABC transporter substrate-binding protein n=1 Tax=Pseudodesulfovibrio cashew TaxID=2678688 RepID=A0A6I6JHL6_9BACT|nr:TRAP transporter substrate-binding protein [Pseudodesulfovibrio cashew]QGY40520.1 C4-dicarboxylate ABC transporter substrate-binding protein [Pseudodesulfovibrio cashew]